MVLEARACPLFETADTLIEAGSKILQYRHKTEWKQQNYDDASRLAELCKQAKIPFVINDRADFAHLLGAALHIGQDDLPPVAARRILPDAVIGFSTHNRRQLMLGNEEPVTYLSAGPIFSTASKLNPDPVLGTDNLRAFRPLTSKPVVAIGGITLANAEAVLSAGANSVAIISGILPESWEPKEVSRRIREWLKITG